MKIYFEGIRDTECRVYLFAEVPSGSVIPDGKNDIIKRDRSGFFDRLIDAYRPFLPQSGAVLNSNFIIITPKNDYFYGFSFNKDLTGWSQQIENGAKLLNIRIGRIVNEDFFNTTEKVQLAHRLPILKTTSDLPLYLGHKLPFISGFPYR